MTDSTTPPSKHPAAPTNPLAVVHDGCCDTADLICAAHRLDHVIALLVQAKRVAGNVSEDSFRYVSHTLADELVPVRTGLEKREDGRFFERYDHIGGNAQCRAFSLIVETHKGREADAMVRGSSLQAAKRLQRYRGALLQAADAALGPKDEQPLAALLPPYIQARLERRIAQHKATLHTLVYPSGHLDVIVPSPWSHTDPIPVFSPGALAALKPLAVPSAVFEIEDGRDDLCYSFQAQITKARFAPIGDDPMAKLRILSSLPDLGSEPFSTEFRGILRSIV
jgi:hypothetical protein